MAAPQLRGERHGHDGGELGVAEVVDVVVLGDDEALPFPLGKRVDGAVQLEQDRPALERELGRIGVRNVDRLRRLSGRAVPEAAALRPCRDVGDDVDFLAGLLEGALEREVVVRAHDQLVRCSSRSQERRELREEAVERRRFHGSLEARVQLVVERAGALHRRDVLRHPRQVHGPVVGNGERARQMRGEIADAVEAEDGDDPAGE